MKEQKGKYHSKNIILQKDLKSLSMDELMVLAEKENIADKWDLNKNGLIKALERATNKGV